jgi:hypothetical protein
MRSALVIAALIAGSACSFERAAAPPPQPQKSALRGCYDSSHRATTQPCAQPLLIIDGQPASWDGPGDMNPSDIYSVEIAKGDSAVVRFGKEARKGVVVITTKQAMKKGTRD